MPLAAQGKRGNPMSTVFDRVDGHKQAVAGRARRSHDPAPSAAPCVDDTRLSALRASIARGEYAVDAERVARRLILRERALVASRR